MTKAIAYGLAALLACALLAGCGGGGDGNASLEQDLADAQAQLAAIEAKAAEEAAAKAAAEKAAADAAALKAAEEAAAKKAADEAAAQKAREDAIKRAAEEEAAKQAARIAALTKAVEALTAAAEETPEPEEEEVEVEEETPAADTPAETTQTPPPVTPPAVQQQQQQATGAPTRAASQLAEHLKDAFGSLPTTFALKASPVQSTVNTRASQKLVRGSASATVSTSTGIGSATIPLTAGSKTGKTVVRTDRDTTRLLLDHYEDRRDSADKTRLMLTAATDTADGTTLEITGGVINHVTTPTTSTKWRIAHPFTAALTARDTDSDGAIDIAEIPEANRERKQAKSYTGYLHGLPGTFVCSLDSCEVTVTPTYADPDDTTGRTTLTSVAVGTIVGTTAVTATTNLRFKPNSGATLQLYESGPVGSDDEYMIYGYWYQEPSSPAGSYAFDWFAEVFPDPSTRTAAWPSGLTGQKVYYDGTAVGMYVEKDATQAVDTYRHGEFVADVVLEADGGIAAGDVSGTIDDFTTTPIGGSTAPVTSGRWVVSLNAVGGTVTATANRITLKGMAGTTTGNWGHAFVAAHPHAAADTPLPAVVGGFDARIEGSLSIVGAFGAESR